MAIPTTYDWDEVTVRELDLFAQEPASYRISQYVDADNNVLDPSGWTVEVRVYPKNDYKSAPIVTWTLSDGDLRVDGEKYVAFNLTDQQTDDLGAGEYQYAERIDDGSNDAYFSQKGTLKVHDVSE